MGDPLLALAHAPRDRSAHRTELDGSPPVDHYAPSSMYAMTAPTATSAPTGCTISTSLPAVSASISTAVLVVSISAMTSPRRTVSPTFFVHEEMRPKSMS